MKLNKKMHLLIAPAVLAAFGLAAAAFPVDTSADAVPDQTVTSETKSLADIIKDAKETISGSKNLTDDQKNTYNRQIDRSKSEDEVNQVLADAKEKADSSKALDQAKFDAKLALSHKSINASDSLKLSDKIDLAASVDEISKILAEADALVPAPEVKSTPMYRVYNKNNGEHLYTTDEGEYKGLIAKTWQDEGKVWDAPTSGVPVLRVYNPVSGEHLYTTSAKEYLELKNAQWQQEGQVFFSDVNQGVPIYRAFNQLATRADSHLFTMDQGEINQVVGRGYRNEGAVFYGVKTAE